MLDTIDSADRDVAIASVTEALAAHASPQGVCLDVGIHLITAAI